MRVNAGAVIWRYSNRKLQILLVHQRNKPKTLWSLPKGGVDPGEDFLAAAKREVQEETNVVIERLDFLAYVDYGKANKRMYCYMGQCPDSSTIKSNVAEVDNAAWFDVGAAKKLVDKRQRPVILALQKILAFGGWHHREPA